VPGSPRRSTGLVFDARPEEREPDTVMSGGSITKELVKRVKRLLENDWPNRTTGSPLPSVEQIATKLQAKFDDLKRQSR